MSDRRRVWPGRCWRLLAVLVAVTTWAVPAAFARVLFQDPFAAGLGRWELSAPAAIAIVDSGDDAHGKVPLPAEEMTCPPVPGAAQLFERAAVVLVAEVHGTVESPAFVAALEPMGFFLRLDNPHLRVVSLDVSHAGGSAWLCTPEGCGVRGMGARVEQGQELFAIALQDELQADGHHGRYFAGEIHASPPAVRSEPD